MATNTMTTLFNSALTGTDVSAGITIPVDVSYIVISSVRNKLLWLCDENGVRKAVLPQLKGQSDSETYVLLELSGCTIKLQSDSSDTGVVYVTAFHGV
jgi:hypothetical protein